MLKLNIVLINRLEQVLNFVITVVFLSLFACVSFGQIEWIAVSRLLTGTVRFSRGRYIFMSLP